MPDGDAKRHKVKSRLLADTALASALRSITAKGGGYPGVSLRSAQLVDPQEAKEMPVSRESCKAIRG